MSTTPNGTAYTRYRHDFDDGTTVYYGVADLHKNDVNIPTVLYCHGSGGESNQFYATPAWNGLRYWMLDHGWAWVEGTGGGGASWGNDDARAAYLSYIDYADTQFSVGGIVPLGRSMGGLVSYWLYGQSPIKDRCIGLIVSSGVTSMAYAGPHFTTSLWNAFGTDNNTDFLVASAAYDPMGFPVTDWDGGNILELVGTADTTVVPESNGLAIRAQWAGHPTVDLLDVRQGGDHSTGNGSYLEVDAMTSFLVTITGGTPVPPDPGHVYRITAEYFIGPDGTNYSAEQKLYV